MMNALNLSKIMLIISQHLETGHSNINPEDLITMAEYSEEIGNIS